MALWGLQDRRWGGASTLETEHPLPAAPTPAVPGAGPYSSINRRRKQLRPGKLA